jgi:hypothetical protein
LKQAAEVLAGGAGVADLELHRLTELHGRTDRDAVAFGVETHDPSDQEVATAELDQSLVDDDARVQTPRCECSGLLVETCDQLAESVCGRSATELEHHVAVDSGDDEGIADGSAPLRDDGLDGAGRHDHAHRAASVDGTVQDEAVAARYRRRRRQTTDDREVGHPLGQLGQQAVDGKRERVGDQHHRAAGDIGGEAADGPSAGAALRIHPDGHSSLDAPGPEADRRALLDLAGVPDDRHGRGPHQQPRRQHGPHGVDDLVDLAQVARRDEHHRNVGLGADRVEHLAHHLAGRVPEQRMLRQCGPEALQDAPPSSTSSTGGIRV